MVRTDLPLAVAGPAIRHSVEELDPELRVTSVETMTERVARAAALPRFQMTILATFAGLSLALAVIGVFGMMMLGVRLRRREFGIRRSLGAPAEHLFGLVFRRTGRLVGAGLALGLVGVFAIRQLIASLLFGVEPGDPMTIGGAALILAATGFLAALLPAARAAAVEAVEVLRAE